MGLRQMGIPIHYIYCHYIPPVSGGRQVTHCVDVCSKRSTPGLQSGRCLPVHGIADVQILHPERDNQQHCASAVQQPSPDMFCQFCLCQTFADQILEGGILPFPGDR